MLPVENTNCVCTEPIERVVGSTFIHPNHEETGHGDRMLPLAAYHCIIPTAQSPNVALHWHSEFEFSLITEGSALYKFGSDEYVTALDDIILIAPNTLHSMEPIDGKTQISDTVVFHMDLLGLSRPDICTVKYLRPLRSGEFGVINHISRADGSYEVIRRSFDKIYELVEQKPPCYELKLKSALFSFFAALYSENLIQKSGISAHISNNRLVTDILTYIDENYRENLSIPALAERFCMSESCLMNYFRDSCGITCHRYIVQTRLLAAGKLLLETENPICDICFDCGFSNLSNFNRHFKQYFGMSPRDYRLMFKESVS